MNIVEFQDWQSFFNFLKSYDDQLAPDAKEGLATFTKKVSLIDKGCSCGKKKRTQAVNIEYISIASVLTDEIKDNIKVITQSDKVIFYNEGVPFLEF